MAGEMSLRCWRLVMGEEAFDEVIIPCEDGKVLHVTGGYGREEVLPLTTGKKQTAGIRLMQSCDNSKMTSKKE